MSMLYNELSQARSWIYLACLGESLYISVRSLTVRKESLSVPELAFIDFPISLD